MSSLLGYYIIDRKSGVSYEPYSVMGNVLLADSNLAIRKGSTVINIGRLVKGLSEKRYRLIPRSSF